MKIIQRIGDKQSRSVMAKDIKKVRKLIPEMHKLCHEPLGFHTNGAYAIAHCQVDQEDPLRFFVLVDGTAVLNPTINKHLGETVRHAEGCMSDAHVSHLASIPRYKKLIVSFTGLEDADAEMEEVDHLTITGNLAFIFQHEVDHMNGKHVYS